MDRKLRKRSPASSLHKRNQGDILQVNFLQLLIVVPENYIKGSNS